jgi:hypothetical protein
MGFYFSRLLVLCLIAAYALLLRITARDDGGTCASYAFCSPVITFAALSGMETAFALLLLAAFLWAVYAAADSLHWTAAPLLVLLIYVTRPDAVLLAVPVLLVERTRRNRRVPVRDLLLLGAGMVTLLCAFRLAYGTALPLPFYAKSAAFSPYDAHFRQISAHAGAIRAGLFAAIALPLVGSDGSQRSHATGRASCCSAAHCSMGSFTTRARSTSWACMAGSMRPRFRSWSWLRLAASPGRGVLPRRDHGRRWRSLRRVLLELRCSGSSARCQARRARRPIRFRAGCTPAWHSQRCCCSWRGDPRAARGKQLAPGAVLLSTLAAVVTTFPLATNPRLSDESYLARHTRNVTSFRGMDTLRACLGERIHVYHSELGVTGLCFQEGRVSDLAGLMSARWLFRTRPFDDLCKAERPDAIFLPHRNYRSLSREVTGSECITSYVRVVEQSSSPLYVRHDRFDAYSKCAKRRRVSDE